MLRGSGSVDKAPNSQWIYARLEGSKHSFITILIVIYSIDIANAKIVFKV